MVLQDKSHRESTEGRRHQVADLLGDLQRLQPAGVLHRHFPLLDSLLLAAEGKISNLYQLASYLRFTFIPSLTFCCGTKTVQLRLCLGRVFRMQEVFMKPALAWFRFSLMGSAFLILVKRRVTQFPFGGNSQLEHENIGHTVHFEKTTNDLVARYCSPYLDARMGTETESYCPS